MQYPSPPKQFCNKGNCSGHGGPDICWEEGKGYYIGHKCNSCGIGGRMSNYYPTRREARVALIGDQYENFGMGYLGK